MRLPQELLYGVWMMAVEYNGAFPRRMLRMQLVCKGWAEATCFMWAPLCTAWFQRTQVPLSESRDIFLQELVIEGIYRELWYSNGTEAAKKVDIAEESVAS